MIPLENQAVNGILERLLAGHVNTLRIAPDADQHRIVGTHRLVLDFIAPCGSLRIGLLGLVLLTREEHRGQKDKHQYEN